MPINLKAPGASLNSAVLIYDTIKVSGGSNDATATLTQVNGAPIAAALEIQSTNGALVLPRMTTANKAALAPVVPGMQVFDTDQNAVSTYSNGDWGDGALVKTVELAIANIVNMSGAALKIIDPIVGKIIIVDKFAISYHYATAAYTTGGPVVLQYGAGAYTAANVASQTIAAANITANADTFAFAPGIGGASLALPLANVLSQGIYVTCSAAFVNPGAAAGTATVKVWYKIVSQF